MTIIQFLLIKLFISIMKENEVVTFDILMNNLYHNDYVVNQVDNVEKSLKKKTNINQNQL